MAAKTRLYFSEKIQSDLISHLTKNQSHYVKDVMRLKVGERFSVFNGQVNGMRLFRIMKKVMPV